MMQPLSRGKRISYLIFFTIIFFAVAPLFIYYAKGYRFHFNDKENVSRTGGIYVSTDQSGMEIYINNILEKRTSIVQKSVFVQDLNPGSYEVRVSKNGLQTWHKNLQVFPELVTEAKSFLIKEEPVLTEITQFLPATTTSSATTTSTTTKYSKVKNDNYTSVLKLFTNTSASSTKIATATSTMEEKNIRKVILKNTDGVLTATWKGERDAIPSYFCINTDCKSEIKINTPSKVLSYDFFPGRDDLVIVRLLDGVYVSEIDDRSTQNIQRIVSGGEYDFRVKNGSEIYLKNNSKIYLVSL
jgi:hypothetical protein